MVSTFSGFYLSLRSMQAQQMALETASHNIANAETEGYTRQRADLAATTPWPYPSVSNSGVTGQLGTGVEVTKIERLRDQYLDIQLRKEMTNLGEWQMIEDALEQVEVIFQEPTETGLNTLINQFWDSWQELSMNPEGINSAVRTTLVETAASLADALRHTSQQLDVITEDMDNIMALKVDEINSIATQINDLNEQIETAKMMGFEPNDLMDSRDLLLDQLSEVIDFSVTQNSDGTIDVNLYNADTGSYSSRLVDGIEGHTNTLEFVSGVVQWDSYTSSQPTGGNTLEISGGELKGLTFVRDELLTNYRDQLNAWTSNLIDAVNTQHAAGYDLDGNAGGVFFSGTDASDIQVDTAIQDDVLKIAAAGIGDHDDDPSTPDEPLIPGDGSNALAISNLRSDINATLGNSFDDYYRNLIAELGVDTHEAQRMVTNQEALVGQLEDRKASISGVNIDEELANMIASQHIYQASARFLDTLDGLLDTLIMRMAW